MKIEYSEKHGSLKFTCKNEGYELCGTVPDSVIGKGKRVINKYVWERMHDHIHQTKRNNVRAKRRSERIKNTNIPVFQKHDSHNLKGRIVNYDRKSLEDGRGLITIILESPRKYRGEDSIYGCFGMAMAGIRVYDDEGNPTRWAIDESKKYLIKIYEMNKKRAIAKKLNKTK